METITEVKTKVRYYHNVQAEATVRQSAETAAIELNKVLEYFPFQSIADIPIATQEWINKTLLDKNPELAKLAKVHRLESLKYEVPQWLTDAAQIYSRWHSVKAGFTQVMQYLKRDGDTYEVDNDKLEQYFESNETYRRYLNPGQAKRLELCKRYIQVTEEAGMNSLMDFAILGKAVGNRFINCIQGKVVPNKNYVLTGEVLMVAPIAQPDEVYSNIVW
jgi:hypothetical protein